MTLKLISKTLPNKYAEQLFKNELSYNSDIDKLNNRIKVDYIRNSQFVDISSQVFLNRVRQKRNQWKKDDIKYREYYKLICRNTYLKYLEANQTSNNASDSNLRYRVIPSNNIEINSSTNNNEIIEFKSEKSNLIKQRSESANGQLHRPNSFISLPPIKNNDETNYNRNLNPYLTTNKKIKEEEKPFSNGKYSTCDKDFLSKLPEKVELTNTDVGKRFLQNKKEQSRMIHKQKQSFAKIQSNAINDQRFKGLVSTLVT